MEEDIGQPIVGNLELSEIGVDPKSTLQRLSFKSDSQFNQEEISDEDNNFQTLDMAIQQMLNKAKKIMPLHCW